MSLGFIIKGRRVSHNQIHASEGSWQLLRGIERRGNTRRQGLSTDRWSRKASAHKGGAGWQGEKWMDG